MFMKMIICIFLLFHYCMSTYHATNIHTLPLDIGTPRLCHWHEILPSSQVFMKDVNIVPEQPSSLSEIRREEEGQHPAITETRYKRHGIGWIDIHGSAQCADCKQIKPNEHFTFYKHRMHPETKLCLYANKKCTACRKLYTIHKKQSERYIRLHHIQRPKPTKDTPYFCDCCQKPIYTSKTLQLDHCHKTGKFRGFTCKSCNISLGNLGDEMVGILHALKYLNSTEQKSSEEIHHMIDDIFFTSPPHHS
jgi:Recombination endonuclease VII